MYKMSGSPTSVLNTNNLLFTSNGSNDRVKLTSAADNVLTLTGTSGSANVRLTGLANPSSAQDAVTKNYIDNLVLGLSWKQTAKCTATSNVAGTYDKAAGTITGSGILASTVTDGIGLTAGDQIDPATGLLVSTRVLLLNQTDAKENGIYYLKQANPYILERTNDANTAAELLGSAIFVQEGTVNADTAWVMATDNIAALDSTSPSNLSYVQFSHVGGNVDAAKIVSGVLDANRIPNLSATKITSGELDPSQVPNINASKVNAGTFEVGRIPNLPATQVTSGQFVIDRIPDLTASKVTTGTFAAGLIPDLDASKVATGTLLVGRIPALDADKITTGTLADGRIPSFNASKINAGTLDVNRVPDLNANKITAGSLDADRVPNLNANKITSGTLADSVIPNLAASKITSGSFATSVIPSLDANTKIDDASIAGSKLKADIAFSTTGALTAASFTASSDARLKQEVKPLQDALYKVKAMTGVSYEFINNPGEKRSGVIAQDLEQVCPEMVKNDDQGMKSVHYMDMMAYMIEAIKELESRLHSIEDKYTAQKATQKK